MIRVEAGPELELETLAALAAGRADPGLSLLLECAMEMRGSRTPAPDAVAGALLESEQPVTMSADALSRVFAAIDGDQAGQATHKSDAPDDAARELIRIPQNLRQRIEDAERRNGWKSNAGLRTLELDLGGAHKAEIMRIPAGAGVPRHTHRGQELTLCLSGGFSDGVGAYGPGDVSITDPTITHRPVADTDGPCYVLAVTDAGLKFTGLLGLLQKAFGR